MVFHSFSFLYFFVVVYAVCRALNGILAKNDSSILVFKFYKLFLLAASYYFYAYWDVRFLILIVFSTTIDYWLGLRISKTTDTARRKILAYASVAVNLGVLGFFKYCNFFMESANVLFAKLGVSIPSLNIILPVGISFYTFQSLSYTLDVYRKELEPTRDFFDFALYVAFFPQLVAGPIVRARDFLPQLLRPRVFSTENLYRGAQVFLYGLFLKAVVADNIALLVDPIFKNPQSYDNLAVWVAVLGYAAQIFCDFAGYSEMAIGLALGMGYWLPINFRAPYLAMDLFDFWRRWHISLSTWLRDYLYISLGGNRMGPTRTCFNVFITMLLGGLWHGAKWNFVMWGCYHGLGLMINRILALSLASRMPDNMAVTFCKWAGTFLFVCLGWVLFRSENMDVALQIYRKLFFTDVESFRLLNWDFLAMKTLFFIPLMVLLHLWIKRNERDDIFPEVGSLVSQCYIVSMIFLIFVFAEQKHTPFIYFQF